MKSSQPVLTSLPLSVPEVDSGGGAVVGPAVVGPAVVGPAVVEPGGGEVSGPVFVSGPEVPSALPSSGITFGPQPKIKLIPRPSRYIQIYIN
jgi:hypothetical protein